MNIKNVFSLLVIGVLGGSKLNAETMLLNFTGGTTNFTSDGSNTWQTFFYDEDDDAFFDFISGENLVDTEGNATAYDFSLRVYNGTDPANSKISITESENAGAAALESTVTPGFEWFDASSPAQLSTSLIDADSPDGIVYKFSGFSPTDFVNFKFVLGINGIGNGDLDVGGGPEGTLFTSGQPGRTFLASGLDTASTGFYLDRTVTGFSSYEVFLGKTIDGDGSAASAINAMQILVVPELSAFVLMEIAFLPIILGLCLRKYFAALVFRKDAVKG